MVGDGEPLDVETIACGWLKCRCHAAAASPFTHLTYERSKPTERLKAGTMPPSLNRPARASGTVGLCASTTFFHDPPSLKRGKLKPFLLSYPTSTVESLQNRVATRALLACNKALNARRPIGQGLKFFCARPELPQKTSIMSAASIYASPKALQSDHQPTESNRKVSSASSSASPFSEALLRAPPHPALKTPVLHVTGLEQSGEADISDQDVMSAVAHCLRAR